MRIRLWEPALPATTAAAALIRELGDRLNLPLDIASGAVVLRDNAGHEWTLEAADQSAQLLVHTTIEPFDASDVRRMAHWLSLNADPATMMGAWLGLDSQRGTIRLYALLPLAGLTVQALEASLASLIRLRAELPLPAKEAASADRLPDNALQRHKLARHLSL